MTGYAILAAVVFVAALVLHHRTPPAPGISPARKLAVDVALSAAGAVVVTAAAAVFRHGVA